MEEMETRISLKDASKLALQISNRYKRRMHNLHVRTGGRVTGGCFYGSKKDGTNWDVDFVVPMEMRPVGPDIGQVVGRTMTVGLQKQEHMQRVAEASGSWDIESLQELNGKDQARAITWLLKYVAKDQSQKYPYQRDCGVAFREKYPWWPEEVPYISPSELTVEQRLTLFKSLVLAATAAEYTAFKSSDAQQSVGNEVGQKILRLVKSLRNRTVPQLGKQLSNVDGKDYLAKGGYSMAQITQCWRQRPERTELQNSTSSIVRDGEIKFGGKGISLTVLYDTVQAAGGWLHIVEDTNLLNTTLYEASEQDISLKQNSGNRRTLKTMYERYLFPISMESIQEQGVAATGTQPGKVDVAGPQQPASGFAAEHCEEQSGKIAVSIRVNMFLQICRNVQSEVLQPVYFLCC